MSDTSTQNYLPIAGIEEGVVVLKDGSLAVVLRIMPINFDLKNELEQNAIIAKYQSFLNSLDFSIQILVRSQRLDLEPYLVGLDRSTKQLSNELLQIHATDYIAFMRSLVSVANIMSKHYYIILTYQGSVTAAKGGVLSLFKKQSGPTLTRSTFNHYRDELNGRANTVAAGLTAMGLRIEALNTQELIELFYGIYNPDISATERLGELENLKAQVVSLKQTEQPAAGTPAAPATTAPAPDAEPRQSSIIEADTASPESAASAGAATGSDRINLNPQESVADKVAIAEVPEEAQKKVSAPETPAATLSAPVEPTAAEPTAPVATSAATEPTLTPPPTNQNPPL
ncbi:MAG: TraC family protein [bacterium]|nr:TraC family protein [bacterium]